MMQYKPIEIDSNQVVINSNAMTTPVPPLNPIKRSRKSARPSKTITNSIDSSFVNQLTKKTMTIATEKPVISPTEGRLLKLSHFGNIDGQTNNEGDIAVSDEEALAIHQNTSSKRPRLAYDKRLEANARERERVHNLTAAFESLRQAIPMYGDQPKLSRLSILRIACSYVLVLGALNEIDFSEGQNAYTFDECFHMLSSTILNELKRKKNK